MPDRAILDGIAEGLRNIIYSPSFPSAFIASAERTGAAIFKKELNFNRNRLLERMGAQPDKDPRELMASSYADYPLPVKVNVDFTRQLHGEISNKSFLNTTHPDLLEDFVEIIGGNYSIDNNDEIFFSPKNNKKIFLKMSESSSAVRSLLDIGFYLQHIVKEGDILMVDEPELNLHPVNQRKLARLFVRLVNKGVKIFITTHSDYIIKELNSLILLSMDQPHLKQIAEREGYRPDELLAPDRVRVYMARKELVLLEGYQRRTRNLTLVPARITAEHGIEAITFDETINDMNRIQDDIYFGD